MNKRELESVMKKYGDTQSSLAKAIGISRGSLNSKINETKKAVFNQPEMAVIKKRYRLNSTDFERIFFT